jgi:hypothetical protein
MSLLLSVQICWGFRQPGPEVPGHGGDRAARLLLGSLLHVVKSTLFELELYSCYTGKPKSVSPVSMHQLRMKGNGHAETAVQAGTNQLLPGTGTSLIVYARHEQQQHRRRFPQDAAVPPTGLPMVDPVPVRWPKIQNQIAALEKAGFLVGPLSSCRKPYTPPVHP